MEFVTVNTPQGRLRGKIMRTMTGIKYNSFQGIPYAKPPVGPLRFKPPEDPEPWTGTRDATKEGAVAPQIGTFSVNVVGNEDCLFLNVYTPQFPPTSPKAVMVWIHGGGLVQGSGNTDVYGPDFLVAEDVVLVTINYRLGALGFLYLEGADITGNNGMRDQVMALKWVRKNIAQFGGDPGNVTIFGHSAGGGSVHYLMLSPLAAGFFHRAIAQSGTANFCGYCVPRNLSIQRAFKLAKLLGCTSEDPQEVADYLRSVPVEKMVTHQSHFLPLNDIDRILAMAYYYPSEECGVDAFLPTSPRNLLREGQFTKVPLIIGVTSAEGKIMLQNFTEKKRRAVFNELNKLLGCMLPPDLAHEIGTKKYTEVAGIIKKFYYGENILTDNTIYKFIDASSDLTFFYPMYQTVQSQIRWSPQNTYVYLFDHESSPEVGVLPRPMDHLPGSPHGAEIPYLFQSSRKPTKFLPGTSDFRVFSEFVKLWTQFAKTGNPSGGSSNVTWLPAEKENNAYLRIRGGFNMEIDMFKERMDFLEDLYTKCGLGLNID